MKPLLPNSDVTIHEVHDLRRKLAKMFPEPHWRESMMQYGAGPKKRQKANQAPRREQPEGSR